MAEGCEYNNSARGSDAYLCTPCADEGNDAKALKYCPDCKEYLCAACIKYHLKFSATRKHTLHDNEFQRTERDSIDTTSDEDQMFKCIYHLDRDIEMYCGDHDMVYCSPCIAKNHRQCSGILQLEEATAKIPINQQDDILRQIDTLQADIQANGQKKEVNLIALDLDKNDILKAIKDTELLIIGKVKALASDVKANTCSSYDGFKKDFQEEEAFLLQAITATDELRKTLETQADLDAKRQFTRYILQKHIIAKTQKMHDDVAKDKKKMKCLMNDEMIQQVLGSDYLGQVVGSGRSDITKDTPLHKMSLKEVTIKGDGDKDTCTIIGICQLFDGTVILADYNNTSLKKLNKDLSTTDKFYLECKPLGICLTGKTEVAVKLENHTVLFISINDKFTKKQSIYIEGGDFFGLVSICNELCCFTGNCIQVYNRRGEVIKTFDKKSFDGTIFQTGDGDPFPVVADKKFIYVSDLNSQVACIDREGSVWSVMKSERLKLVRRACIASNGIICVAGYHSGNIMMFNQKGICLGELVEGLVKPDSLCFDNKKHQLFIGHENKNIITIITTG
ncbi:uncharacterized protein LOC132712843 [Ruditapes philippinarum]|uniref:uncharacterized protein LOC132712843 n=1 Tax=Ruditapes philippinarum TaxID=129788 RepID=UPI00295BE219|nr:uncharacterized protein LOC132712843 [Ruditapes philippinarum]